MEPGGTTGPSEAAVQVKVVQIPAKCLSSTTPQPSAEAAAMVDQQGVTKVVSTAVRPQQPSSSSVSLSGQQASTSVVVITKRAVPASSAVVRQVAPLYQGPPPVRTVMFTMPTPVATHTAAVSHRPAAPASQTPQLPANIQIPAGMMLIRSTSGQMMLVSQQALAQVQQPPRVVGGQLPRVVGQQVPAATGNKINKQLPIIRMAAPSTFQPAPAQKAVVKVIHVTPKPPVVQGIVPVADQASRPRPQAANPEGAKVAKTTFSQETLESVKKCKNFLVTLIKLACSDSRSASMANNVRGLVKSLLVRHPDPEGSVDKIDLKLLRRVMQEGKIEAEEFTQQLYQELKSTPQPCLVPFLEKSLPAVRQLIADPKAFVQQASSSTCKTGSDLPETEARPGLGSSQQKHQEVPVRPGLTSQELSKDSKSKNANIEFKCSSFSSGRTPSATSLIKVPFHQDSTRQTKLAFQCSASYKEDDDINDVALMAGVNLREENARILTTNVGSVVQSCQDQPFLSPGSVLQRILHAGQALGVTDVGAEVVALVSHATQEYIRGLAEKLTVTAAHRRASLEGDSRHVKTSDVRSQLRFLGEVESLRKKRQDDEERERLLRLAKSRSHSEDPQHQQLKQRAKELQQLEEAELKQKEANLAALAAIGPRKKRTLEQTE